MKHLIEKGLELGLSDQSYTTVRHGGVKKYKGWAFVRDENGTAHILAGFEPKGTLEEVYQQGGVDIYRMEGDQLDLEDRIRSVEKTIQDHLDYAHEFEASQPQPFVAFAWCQQHAGTPEYDEYQKLWYPVNFWREKRVALLKREASLHGLLVH
jgi:hypothetical protein